MFSRLKNVWYQNIEFVWFIVPKVTILVLGILVLLLTTGCSTLGEVEALNDVGLGKQRQAISAYNKTLNVLGVQSRTRSASTINRAYGHTQNTDVSVDDVNDVPYVIRDLKELSRYIQALQ